MVFELKFIKKHIKKTLPERFDIFEKQMQQQQQAKLQPQLKLKVAQPIEHQNSKVGIKGKQGESAAKQQKSEKSSGDRSPSSQEHKLSENQVAATKKSSDIALGPPKNSKKSFFGSNFTDLIEEEPVQDHSKIKQKRLDNLLKLKSSCSEVNAVWNRYWGNSKGLLRIQEYEEVQREQKLELGKWFGHYEKVQNKMRNHLEIEFRNGGEVKVGDEEVVIVDASSMLVVRNVEVSEDMILWLLVSSPPWHGLRHVEFVNTRLSEAALKMLLTVLGQECERLESIGFSRNRVSRAGSRLLRAVVARQRGLRRLKLSGVGMDTRSFVEMCLAICEGEIRDIDFSDNQVDERGLKALETLLRYVKSLNSVDVSGNHFAEESEESKAALFRQLRKTIIYNAGLKNKNIKI